MTAAVVCVTVNNPSTGPVSLASVVPAMLTSALSPSRMSMLALLLIGSMVMPGSLAVMAVRVTVTVSVPSTSPSATMPVTSIVALVALAGMVLAVLPLLPAASAQEDAPERVARLVEFDGPVTLVLVDHVTRVIEEAALDGAEVVDRLEAVVARVVEERVGFLRGGWLGRAQTAVAGCGVCPALAPQVEPGPALRGIESSQIGTPA